MINHPTHSKAEASPIVIDIAIARKVLETVDAGLSSGVGNPIPGQMCVEAAVCYALGLPHFDDPQCVDPILRSLKIRLNDSKWSSREARAKGLRRLALIQLGSKGNLDGREFAKRLADLACQTSVPIALRAAASIHKDPAHKAALLEAANRCEATPSREAAENAKKIARDADAAAAAAAAAYAAAAADAAAAYAAAYAAASAAAYAAAYARDKILSDFAEGVVQILIEMKVPGAQWLPLTEVAA
jgi:hypothetical protein